MINLERRVKLLQDSKKKYNICICVTGVAEREEIKDGQEKDWKINGGKSKCIKKNQVTVSESNMYSTG